MRDLGNCYYYRVCNFVQRIYMRRFALFGRKNIWDGLQFFLENLHHMVCNFYH